MSLVICTFAWGNKYKPHYVERLAAGIKRNMRAGYGFVVITDNPSQFITFDGVDECWSIPGPDGSLLLTKGCFARLRLFDPTWQALHGIGRGDAIACVDLDVVVTGALDPLFTHNEPFAILQGVNSSNPCPYNGSLWMLRAGYRPDVWTDFSLGAAAKVPFHEFPDDQAWLAHKLPGAKAWKAGPESGLYAFKKPGWPNGDALPHGARLVAFPGSRDPSMYTALPWVKEHW